MESDSRGRSYVAPDGVEMNTADFQKTMNVLAEAEEFVVVAVGKNVEGARYWTMLASSTVSHRTLLEYGLRRSEAWLDDMDDSESESRRVHAHIQT